MATILIKNVNLLDGSGKPAVKSEILVKNEKIAAVEDKITHKADSVIDGEGAYLSPGFIDVGSQIDRRLDIFSNALAFQKKSLLEGVTTVIGGQDGISLTPLVYGSLQSLRSYADVNKVNVNWHTIPEFFKTLKKLPLSVNFGTLLGHLTVRRAIIGEPIFRNLTANELKILKSILEKNLKAGGLGISTGLDSPLISDVSYFEIKELAQLAAKHKKIFSINPKNKEEGMIESIKRIIYLSKETGAKILINDWLPTDGFEKDYLRSIELIEKNSAEADIHAVVYPFREKISLIESLLPKWAVETERRKTLANLKEPEKRKKILLSLSKISKKEIENMAIAGAPLNEYLVGKTIKEFCDNRNLKSGQGLAKLMEITGLRAEIARENVNYETLMKILPRERTLIASSGSPILSNSPAGGSAFKKFLNLAENEKIMPVETAIRKITSLPAQKLGLKGRGEIKTGFFADLTIFKNGEIKDVILNGKAAVKEGECQNVSAGKILT